MNATARKIRAREIWIGCYKELGSISKAARRCGIPRSTLYRWLKRFERHGKEGLKDLSKKPLNFANQKVTTDIENLILETRKKHKWGPQRIHNYFKRKHDLSLSPPTIWRVLKNHEVKLLKKYRSKNSYKRYSKKTPGSRVQIDVMKVRPGTYQFSAIDDCTRLRVLRLYPRKTAANAILFLGEILDNLPFPIQRMQSDWGSEFFNDAFQYELMEHFIKFRPIKPRSPHLNGKIERSQQTDKSEFYKLLDLRDKTLPIKELLSDWEKYYNYHRPHSSLGGKTPWEKYLEVENKIPIQPDVTTDWYKSGEKIKVRDSSFYRWFKKHPELSHMS